MKKITNSCHSKIVRIPPLLFLCILLALSSCSYSGRAAESATAFQGNARRSFQPMKVHSIAIYPLQNSRGMHIGKTELDSLSLKLSRSLEIGSSYSVLGSSNQSKRNNNLLAVESLAVSQTEKAVRFGRATGAQAVIHGLVTRFKKTKSNSREKAAAGFSLWMLDTSNGEILWSATYDDQQQSLSHNLFLAKSALKNGLQFQNVDQLFEQGFKQVADNLQGLRSTWIEQ